MNYLAKRMSRLGTETAFDVLARAGKLAAEGRDIINLGIGQPDFPTPDHVVEAAVKALHDGHHGYTPANGILPLREAIADDIKKYRQADINPEHIVVVPGGKVTMFFAMQMFGEAGVEIIYPDPGFPIYKSAIDYSGATSVPMTLHENNGFSFSADEVLNLITERTRLIIINSPANPTGGITPREEIDKLVAGLDAWPGVYVMSDEIYGRMLYDGKQHVSLLEYESLKDRLILLDGFSKTFAMTGWRLGYGVWPKHLVEPATRLAINSHSCVNAAAQWAGIAALTGPQNAVDTMMAAFDERRHVMVTALNTIDGITCQMPGGAFYAFPNITGTGLTAKDVQEGLLNDVGVATVAGTSFGAAGEGYIRFSYANSKENIEHAMDRVKAFLER